MQNVIVQTSVAEARQIQSNAVNTILYWQTEMKKMGWDVGFHYAVWNGDKPYYANWSAQSSSLEILNKDFNDSKRQTLMKGDLKLQKELGLFVFADLPTLVGFCTAVVAGFR